MKKIEVAFFDAGGGHRAAATALEMVIQAQQRPWEVCLTNLQELLDPTDILKKYAGIRIQDFYNSILRTGWTLGSTELMRSLQVIIRAYRRPIVRILKAHWKETQPGMLVSVVPHFNRALFESFRAVFPDRPFVTILTDIADYPPHFWLERQKQYAICGSQKAAEQAAQLGYSAEQIFQASGMILHPRFYEPQAADRAAERQRLGLRPNHPTGLVLFGGHGSRAMLDIAERLDESQLEVQLILLCGKNEVLAKELRERKWRVPHVTEGFTKEVPYYMHLSDFFIGKPGPGSLSEALSKQLPVIVECNSWTLPQERYNAQWIKERNVGIVLRSFRKIVPAVTELLEPEKFGEFRANTTRKPNRAIFEIPDFLDRIFQREADSARLFPQARNTSAPGAKVRSSVG
jgi:1,2-diacylglycerol 3-beta-galactosyltransferase